MGGCYQQAPFFSEYIDAIKKCLDSCSDTLVDVDIRTIQLLLELLHIKIKIRRASDLNCGGTPVECLAQLCKQVSATGYIFGEGGGLAYHGASYLKYNGITPHQQHYRQGYLRFAETYYPARPNLSIIDLLFNLGAQMTSEIVRSFWSIEPAGEDHDKHAR